MASTDTRALAAGWLDDDQIGRLQDLLDRVAAPLQPLDVSSMDGFLCGVLLQPNIVEAGLWLPYVTDIDGRALPPGFDRQALHELVRRRHAQLDQAIVQRQWFDPLVFELDAPASPSRAVLSWVAGFAAAMDCFPQLMRTDDARLLEPLALLYMHFDADDLEDAGALQDTIDTLEPPATLAEAVQDIVRSVMLIADVTRPLAPLAPPRPARRAPAARKAQPRR